MEDYPVPAPVSFDFGRMVFEQVVTTRAERDAAWDLRDVHRSIAKQVATHAGYAFAGEGLIEREHVEGSPFALYRLTVPVKPA